MTLDSKRHVQERLVKETETTSSEFEKIDMVSMVVEATCKTIGNVHAVNTYGF